MKIICNATPLIAFSRIHNLKLMRKVLKNITIPEAVYNEIAGYGLTQSDKTEVPITDWIIVEQVRKKDYIKFLCTGLDPGESEVIALAYEQKADLVVIDEKSARRTAAQVGLQVIGSIGILIRAKEQKLISHIKPLWDDMIRAGLRYSDFFYKQVLSKLGEL